MRPFAFCDSNGLPPFFFAVVRQKTDSGCRRLTTSFPFSEQASEFSDFSQRLDHRGQQEPLRVDPNPAPIEREASLREQPDGKREEEMLLLEDPRG